MILLLMGAATSFIFGIGMTVTMGCFFMLLPRAPTLIEGRMNPTSVLLFIFYWGIEFHQATGSAGACEVAPIAGVHR